MAASQAAYVGSIPIARCFFMFFVYVLRDEISGRLYIGSCSDLDRRLGEHQRKGRSLYKLIYKEERPTKEQAQRREMYLKSGNGRRALKNLLIA